MRRSSPGKNLALSPGAVVWRNDVLELIQYAPATAEVHARPQLIVPPQINKFYIFDLGTRQKHRRISASKAAFRSSS